MTSRLSDTGAAPAAPSATELRATFAEPSRLTIGLEEELMLLDPETLDLAPRAPDVLALVDGDARYKLELPAAQLEIVLPPAASVPEVVAGLASARRDLAEAARGTVRLAAAGAHPFAAAEGALNAGARYDGIAGEYASIARRQLVFGLQVHVAIGDADAALAVYNALRGHLPELAALAAAAPFHAGRDTGLASVRPTISGMLPRQGVPPAFRSWEAFADSLRWVREPRLWWWEARPHPAYGTIEVRVPDAQRTVEDAAGVAAVVHALTGRLLERHDAGERLPAPESWRIAENRWAACRHGLEARLADLETGVRRPARERLGAMLDDVAPVAERLGCAAELEHARGMLATGRDRLHRDVAERHGLHGLVDWLAGCYAPSKPG